MVLAELYLYNETQIESETQLCSPPIVLFAKLFLVIVGVGKQ